MRLPGGEFIERFLMHVLPSGFKRIREYGLLSPACKQAALAAARAALEVAAPSPIAAESVADFLRRVARIEHEHCPRCGRGRMQVLAVIPPLRWQRQPRAPP